MENIHKIFDFLKLAGELKNIRRYKASPEINGDSVADHSYRLCLMAYLVAEELNLKIDKYRAVKIALIHDLVEAINGDVDYRLIVENKYTADEKFTEESRAIEQIKNMLPDKIGQEIYEYWHDYEKGESPEAKFVKAMDKIEGLVKLIEDGHKTFYQPDVVATYSNKEVIDFPEIAVFHRVLKQRMKAEFIKGNFEWKEEYEINL